MLEQLSSSGRLSDDLYVETAATLANARRARDGLVHLTILAARGVVAMRLQAVELALRTLTDSRVKRHHRRRAAAARAGPAAELVADEAALLLGAFVALDLLQRDQHVLVRRLTARRAAVDAHLVKAGGGWTTGAGDDELLVLSIFVGNHRARELEEHRLARLVLRVEVREEVLGCVDRVDVGDGQQEVLHEARLEAVHDEGVVHAQLVEARAVELVDHRLRLRDDIQYGWHRKGCGGDLLDVRKASRHLRREHSEGGDEGVDRRPALLADRVEREVAAFVDWYLRAHHGTVAVLGVAQEPRQLLLREERRRRLVCNRNTKPRRNRCLYTLLTRFLKFFRPSGATCVTPRHDTGMTGIGMRPYLLHGVFNGTNLAVKRLHFTVILYMGFFTYAFGTAKPNPFPLRCGRIS